MGATLVVDAIQSLGAHPFDVSEVRPDFLVASSYKWLLGPYGVGFMYVGEEYREGKPIEHNWINRRGSQDFSGLVAYQDAFQPGARRYDVGERSNFALLPMAAEALLQLLDWGVENVSETIGTLTDLIEAKAGELGIVRIPKERRARHMIGLMLGSEPQATSPPSSRHTMSSSACVGRAYASRHTCTIRKRTSTGSSTCWSTSRLVCGRVSNPPLRAEITASGFVLRDFFRDRECTRTYLTRLYHSGDKAPPLMIGGMGE